MFKRDLFLVLYNKKVESFKKDFEVYSNFIDKKYKRRKSYKTVKMALTLLEKHLEDVSVYRAYNRNINFDAVLIKWTADLNFLTAQAFPGNLCISFLYRHLDEINSLVYGYFE